MIPAERSVFALVEFVELLDGIKRGDRVQRRDAKTKLGKLGFRVSVERRILGEMEVKPNERVRVTT